MFGWATTLTLKKNEWVNVFKWLLSAPCMFGWRGSKLDNRGVLDDWKLGKNYQLNVK